MTEGFKVELDGQCIKGVYEWDDSSTRADEAFLGSLFLPIRCINVYYEAANVAARSKMRDETR